VSPFCQRGPAEKSVPLGTRRPSISSRATPRLKEHTSLALQNAGMDCYTGHEHDAHPLIHVPADPDGPADAALPLEGRSCADCALCCKLLAIGELAKPAGSWCRHAVEARRCAIYENRPATCRAWHCGYLFLPFLGEHWHPARCGMVLHWNTAQRELTIVVDEGLDGGWRLRLYAADVAMIYRWCLKNRHRFTIREQDASWVFDPRGLSASPLLVTAEEDVLGLGPMPLLKLQVSLRRAGGIAGERYRSGHALLRANGLVRRQEVRADELLMRLAAGVLYSAGLVLDAGSRTVLSAASEPELAARARDYLEEHGFCPEDGLPLVALD
jgi:hypothetical protein